MSYSVCPNCGQKALTVATRCPRCGFALEAQFLGQAGATPKRGGLRRAVLIVGSVLVVLAVNAVALRLKAPPSDSTQVARPSPTAIAIPPVPPADEPASASPVQDSVQPPAESGGAARVTPPESTSPAPAPAAAAAPSPAPVPAAVVTQPAGVVRRYANTWINVRVEPRNSAAVLRILNPGDAVEVDSLTHGWYRVLSNGELEGYVDFRFLDPVPPPATP